MYARPLHRQQGDIHPNHMNSPHPATSTSTSTSTPQEFPPSPSPNLPPRPPPRRRENAVQPPAITTSLSGVTYRGGCPGANTLPTPATMSSPFTPSSVPLSGMSSPMPMGARLAGYVGAAPYNPQEWGPIRMNSTTSPPIGVGALTPMATPMSAAPRGMSDELAHSGPPPPYSPPRSSSQARSPRPPASTAQPSVSTGYPHQNSAGPAPQSILAYNSPGSRRRPVSMVYSENSTTLQPQQQQPQPQHTAYPPPPPGARNAQGSPFGNGSRLHGLSIVQGNTADTTSPGRLSPEFHQPTPPASRRAASTGDLERTHGYGSRRWAPGMPLPPPPPGPPPRGSSPATRQPSNEYSYSSAPRERTRRPPMLGTTLPTVPPTPADWVDADERSRLPSEPVPELPSIHVQTQMQTHTPAIDDNATTAPSVSQSDGSTRSSNRTVSAKGIRERRIETRLGNTPTTGPGESPSSNAAWPADLVLASPGRAGSGLSRTRTVMKSTPRSARSNPEVPPKSPFAPRTAVTEDFPTPRARTTPRRDLLQNQHNSDAARMQTPPFSPGFEGPRSTPVPTSGGGDVPSGSRSGMLTLPTPPLSVPPVSSPRNGKSRERPISHLLHLPVDASPTHIPLVPRKPSLRRQRSSGTEGEENGNLVSGEDFVRESELRYGDFLAKEGNASCDADGLRTFCEFIIAESAVRRKRYDSVWATGSFDLDDFISNLFPEPEQPTQVSITQSSPSLPSVPASPAVPGRLTVDTGPWQYRPTLSPIASMSISNDEMSSRGRAPSRWWESSESGGKAPSVRRTKRETKYMGLPREMREAMQMEAIGAITDSVDNGNENENEPGFPLTNPFAGEYPPEKVGLHEDGAQIPLRRAPSNSREKLDISRLVTLPPSYPRHYPAVNNSHPDLSFYRSTVRSVSDLSELKSTKQSYEDKIKELRDKYEKRMTEERRNFMAGMNCGISEGSISYAEAAEAEAVRKSEEYERERELVQAEFDLYQEQVYKPMQSILSDRVNITSTCIDELRGKLSDSAHNETPNQTQEGGDEQPELLEKLTQLKWLFEARETLYREQFTLQSDHDEKYRSLVTLPYQQSHNHDKLLETDGFFTRDAQDRAVSFAADTFRRFESFMAVIEDNVSRGVETQLSAFWDIAPTLLDVLQCVPDDIELRGFAVKIPQKEYDENPSYFRHPLQYLYSLVSHAERSTFQFIEAQTNLFCLLHEVRSGLMNANARYMELWRVKAGEEEGAVRNEMRESREREERVLTADLKEKVGMVEEQWDGALGKILMGVKGRVRRWLEGEGGWEEMLQMEVDP